MKPGYVVALLLTAATAIAQPAPDTLWTRRYGGDHSDRIRDLQETADGGYILAGYSLSYSTDTRYWVIRTNSAGDTLWTRLFWQMNDPYTPHVQVTSDGGFILALTTVSVTDISVTRLDSDGNQIWNRVYGGAGYDYAAAIEPVGEGGYVLAGLTSSFGAGGNDMYLLRIMDTGDTLWTRTFGGTGYDAAVAARETEDGGFIVLGTTQSFGVQSMYLVKTDTQGYEQWHRTYGGTGNGSSASDVRVTRDGGFVLAGTYSYNGNWIYIVRTNSNGDTLWTARYGMQNSLGVANVVEEADGSVVVGGFGGATGGERFFLSKVSEEGAFQWLQTYNTGSWHDLCFVMRQTRDHGFMLGGSSWYQNALPQDARIVKIAPDCTVPQAPDDVAIIRDGNNVVLRWSAVTQTVQGCPIPMPEYRVYRAAQSDGAFDLIGSTTELSFTDPLNADEGARFYEVRAATP